MSELNYARGLEGVIAGESAVCRIDGVKGELLYRGYSIEDLAANCSFEEVVYLLAYGELPGADKLSAFSKQLRLMRTLSGPVKAMIREFPAHSHPMEMLQSVISYLGAQKLHRLQGDRAQVVSDSLHLVAQISSVIAAWDRRRQGLSYIPPRMDLSHGANFLYMLHGEEPDAELGRIMDICFTLHAEHGFNASTFTARVVASTLSTSYASVSSAIGSLFGPLHGGANEKVLEMLAEIGRVENVVPWLDEALASKKKIVGMGHRVYRVKDPRAKILEAHLCGLAGRASGAGEVEILLSLEDEFRRRMDEKGKAIYPNVDFFSGALYRLMGIEPILFTPIFAASRVAGWLAHIFEQWSDNRIFRPSSLYVGWMPRAFIPLDERDTRGPERVPAPKEAASG